MLAGAALQPSTAKANTSSTTLMATEISETALYFRNFWPVGDRAWSMRPLGERSTGRWYLEGIASSDLAQPLRAGLGRAHLRGTVDGDEPEGRSVSERPLEVVERAPVRVAADV